MWLLPLYLNFTINCLTESGEMLSNHVIEMLNANACSYFCHFGDRLAPYSLSLSLFPSTFSSLWRKWVIGPRIPVCVCTRGPGISVSLENRLCLFQQPWNLKTACSLFPSVGVWSEKELHCGVDWGSEEFFVMLWNTLLPQHFFLCMYFFPVK